MEETQIIAVTGYYYTGSSAVIGLFQEFDNATTFGCPDQKYTVSKTANNTEVTFFSNGILFHLVERYFNGSGLEQDFWIKRFLNLIYRAYDNKSISGWDKTPFFYTDSFLSTCTNFLYSVLDLDDFTLTFMKTRRFPTALYTKDTIFEKCSFINGEGRQRYIFYKFKKMAAKDFEKELSKMIDGLFSIPSKPYLILDQIFNTYTGIDVFKFVNKYKTGKPIKNICVYRDPRDAYAAAFKANCMLEPVAKKIVQAYGKRLISDHIKDKNPNQLMINFDDLVLKYDEVVKKILDFTGIDSVHHVAPRSVFDPEISKVTIGAYKEFMDQDLMEKIKEGLPEYCPSEQNNKTFFSKIKKKFKFRKF